MQEAAKFRAGDRVRHAKRPEWGPGQIQKVESVTIGGRPAQRLIVRFSNAGLKTLSSVGAAIESLEEATPHLNGSSNGNGGSSNGTMVAREEELEGGWLGAISKKKPEDAMVELPDEATDPFRPKEARLKATLDLFRFQPTGASLIDWAVARSGMDDPLSRFTRHELEQHFERWSFLRQKHLAKVIEEVKHDRAVLERALASAPPAARKAVSQLSGRR